MSPACRRVALLVWLVGSGVAFADDEVSPPECADEVCVVNVIAEKLIAAPCVGYSVLAAYSKSNGAALIQCSKPAAEDNKVFIYDRRDRTARSFEFNGGRFIRPDYLAKAQTQGVPDKFGPVPLCPAQNREAAKAGQLLVAEKQPTTSENDPYCYRIHHVVTAKGSLSIRSDDGKELSPLADKAATEWNPLRENLSHYVDPQNAAGTRKQAPHETARNASIGSATARLFTSPNSAAASKMYLVKGDKVQVIDNSKMGDGWCLIRYVTKTGKTIEKWAKAQDLELQDK
jgi:hypothetical protein